MIDGLSETRQSTTNVKEIRAQASVWLRRREFQDWDAATQKEFDAWRKASPANAVAYLRVEQIWRRADKLRVLKHPTRAEKSLSARLKSILPKVGAAIVIAGLIGFAGQTYFANGDTKTYATPVGAHETISLADGSKIELNTDTVLRVRVNEKGRAAELVKGEAYFQIRHDAAHPFVVTAADHRVTDLGTKFFVRRDEGPLEVALLEGSARIETVGSNAPSHAVVLRPGDVALATTGSMSVSRTSSQGLAAQFAWRQGLLVFNHITLADAAAEFNRYNQTKLIVADRGIAARTIGGTFRTSDVEGFTEITRQLLNLRVEKLGGNIVITR
jgi:transmembrane sensor